MPLLELDLPLLELLDFALDDEDFAELLLFALLELDFTELEDFAELLDTLELDFAELDDTGGSELLDATLELLWIASHFAVIVKIPDAVEGIAVTILSSSSQPKKV